MKHELRWNLVQPIPYTLLRANLNYQLPFRRPIFDFSNVGGTFFTMIHNGLAGRYTVKASDFLLRPSNNLGEVQYRYNLFGAAASVTLAADRLLFDFPNVTPADSPIVMSVVQTIHDALPEAFPHLGYDKVETLAYSHLDLGDVAAVDRVLERFLFSNLQSVPALGNVVQRPAGRLDLTAEDQSWQCACSMERSLLAGSAVFVVSNLTMAGMTEKTPLAEKVAKGEQITSACYAVFGLEQKRAD